KRRARTLVYESAKRVTEAQFQDAIRLQIDNLYTTFVDVVAARETLRYSQTYARGLEKLLEYNRQLLESGFIQPTVVDTVRAQVEQAQLQVHEATQALKRAKRTLGLLLNIPRDQTDAIELRSRLKDTNVLPLPEDELIRTALASRPDLLANRLGVS